LETENGLKVKMGHSPQKKRVLFIFDGTPHYYNLVLSRLNSTPDFAVELIAPLDRSNAVGDGVYQTEDGANFPIHRLSAKTIFRRFSSFEGLAQTLEKIRPDIVVVTQSHLPAFGVERSVRRVRKRLGFPVLLKTIPFMLPTYEECRDAKSGMGFLRNLKQFLWARFQRWIFGNVATAHVNYIDDAKRIFSSYGVPAERIFITRNSPDTDALFATRAIVEKSGLHKNPYRLIHVGRLVEWKRVDLLLRAAVELRKRFPKLEVAVIGEGPQREEWENLAGDLGLGAAVKFLGGVYDPKTLAREFMESGVYVLAGMGGLSINDAMAFALPVVCSVCDGTEKILVRDGVNGFYFQNGDASSLSEKIGKILESNSLREKMALASTEIIRRDINIQTVLDGYRSAFEAVTAKRG
jgi:glycosyltransferase involved in cell wall biosynthesis